MYKYRRRISVFATKVEAFAILRAEQWKELGAFGRYRSMSHFNKHPRSSFNFLAKGISVVLFTFRAYYKAYICIILAREIPSLCGFTPFSVM